MEHHRRNLLSWDNIKETSQSWHYYRYRYCSKTRKWLSRPVFKVKFRWSNRAKEISIKDAMDNIFGPDRSLFTVSDDLRKWIEGSKYAHLLDINQE